MALRAGVPEAGRGPGARGRQLAVVPGDGVRAAAAVSVAVAAVSGDLVAVALFLLVLGGVMVPRAIGVGAALDVSYGGTLLVAAWAARLEWYRAVPWLDLVVHAAATGLIAVMAHLVLVRRGIVSGGGSRANGRPGAATVLSVVGLGAVVAVLWELGEWAGHTFVDDRIGVGYDDTVSDLASGLVGALAAGVLLLVVARRSEAREAREGRR
ncbi:hypothetical protein GCM10025865_10410 [Paraoerskovia sediminicola]|uniref:DUF2238 domain-containing protein n=1 Tax=Paraoerskovia sediminicola TaxID=1138587 RepID=A0ABN6XAB6_9CELL|nr:hypothetical protein [Paraoerskovia sediminicola]BDZ41742.1 hypothetical protein GCM10025865_10410 [Paraoerskovia sediminicola]